jgi:hypothetical protein
MKSKNKYLRFKSFIGGWKVFAATVLLFGAGSIAIAATAEFPLPYDEQYHFTLIQHYSQQLSPFIDAQPAELATAGDATRYGSYLSHYLLSFPLRFITLFTNDIATQVFLLRLINIAFVVGALVLFRLFVLRLMKSGVAANGAVALLAVLPVTSLLAAHINYDNLILLTFAGLLVMAQVIVQRTKAGEGLRATLLLSFVAVALLGCLVKFTFLPLAAMMLAFTATVLMRYKAWPKFQTKRVSVSLIAALLLCVAASGLFSERYVGNLIVYKTLQPDCEAIQPLNVCMQYGPWACNYGLEQAAANDVAFEGRSVQGYLANIGAPLMVRGLGGVNDKGIVAEIPKPTLISLMATAALLAVGMLGAAVMYRKDALVLMVVSAMGLYVAALFQRNYSEFMSLHEIVAVQGRYIVPLVVPFVVIGFIGLRMYAKHIYRAFQDLVRLLGLLRTIHPDEAYERTATYWSAKVWRRGIVED